MTLVSIAIKEAAAASCQCFSRQWDLMGFLLLQVQIIVKQYISKSYGKDKAYKSIHTEYLDAQPLITYITFAEIVVHN